MSTKRKRKGYHMRRPKVSAEAVALFVRCEKLIRLGVDDPFREPEHPQRDEYRAAERELMRLLGLCIFTDCSPLHHRRPLSPGLAETWPRARELRRALLELAKAQEKSPREREGEGEGICASRDQDMSNRGPASNARESIVHNVAPSSTRSH